jgi:hypothetical protein
MSSNRKKVNPFVVKPVTSNIPSYKVPDRNAHHTIVSSKHTGVFACGQDVTQKRYSDEMLERELKAQEEIERKKKRVSIAYNKGAYQYITDGTDPKDIGKK